MLTTLNTPKHFLVTGGVGFIGSHLVDLLIARGHKVTVLDNLSTGKVENKHPKADLIVGDTTDYATVEAALVGMDGCFHLAAVASVEKSTIEWAQTHSVNITSTVNIFQAVSRMQKRIPVVYTSSAAVYGDCDVMPIKETTPKNPLTAYGVDKYACDLHGVVAWHVHGVPNIGMRPFNIYGPRQDPSTPYSGVISIFFDRMRKAEPITIFGDGFQTRDFVFVGDAVKAFAAAMDELNREPTGHDVVNICTGRPTTVQNLADIIAALVHYPMTYGYKPARKGDIRMSVGDPAHLLERLRLTLTVSLREGLMAMLNRDVLSAQEQLLLELVEGSAQDSETKAA